MGFPLADFIRTVSEKNNASVRNFRSLWRKFFCVQKGIASTNAQASFNLLRITGIAQLKKTPHLEMRSFAHSLLDFAASDYYAWRLSNEAPTKALIKRCGRVGREINSGWNWQPTKNLFSGISTISTKRLSGDTPEKTIPFASKISRYLLLNS